MPLIIKKQFSESISVAVWQIAETESFFYNHLQLLQEDEAQIKNVKLQKVRLQKLACRMALSELQDNNQVKITYSKTGQPQLPNYRISFAHTENCATVAMSKIPVGIDMEELTNRILPLYPRFMSRQEIAGCDVNHLKDIYYYWCAKEAMYKWYAKGNLDFIEDLYVDKNENKGIILKKHILQLIALYIENKIIVVCR